MRSSCKCSRWRNRPINLKGETYHIPDCIGADIDVALLIGNLFSGFVG
jgi:hypothetical protein